MPGAVAAGAAVAVRPGPTGARGCSGCSSRWPCGWRSASPPVSGNGTRANARRLLGPGASARQRLRLHRQGGGKLLRLRRGRRPKRGQDRRAASRRDRGDAGRRGIRGSPQGGAGRGDHPDGAHGLFRGRAWRCWPASSRTSTSCSSATRWAASKRSAGPCAGTWACARRRSTRDGKPGSRLRDALEADQVVVMQGDRAMPGQKGAGGAGARRARAACRSGPSSWPRSAAARSTPSSRCAHPPAAAGSSSSRRSTSTRPPPCRRHPPALLQIGKVIEKFVPAYPDQWLVLSPAFVEDSEFPTQAARK